MVHLTTSSACRVACTGVLLSFVPWLTHLEAAKLSCLSCLLNIIEKCKQTVFSTYTNPGQRLSCEICVSRFSTSCLKNYSCYHYNRHRKNREAASELLMRLKDNRDLQKFLQDCQEVCLPLTSPFLVSSKSQPTFGRRAPGIIKLIEVTNSYHM